MRPPARRSAAAAMIADPPATGRALAELYAASEPALWRDLAESILPSAALAPRLRREWECLALYACLRGLVAAGGFGEPTERAIEALHAAVYERWAAEPVAGETLESRRARVTARYEAFGRLAREADASGRTSPSFGLHAAQCAAPDGVADPDLAGLLGDLHEMLAEGAAETVRRAELS